MLTAQINSMKRVNIIRWHNGVGSSRTTRIISQVLSDAGFQVTVNGVYPRLAKDTNFDRAKRFLYKKYLDLQHEIYRSFSEAIFHQPPYDINLFLEFVEPKWFPYARVNLLIPNQEWFQKSWLSYLDKFDRILCKTKYAQEIFDKLGCQTEFISFTSFDRLDSKQTKNYDTFFHLAGRSLQKGTNTLIDLWLQHPEWPCIKIVQNPQNARPVAADNIEYITEYVDDALLREYQNYHGIHLCVSEAEGFGHYIVEAMSCQAVIITTNAPPMNEAISSERGILVDYNYTQVQRLGTNYYVDRSDLERKVEEVLEMDLVSKKRLGENARYWYEENERFFKRNIVELLSNI